eukprot:720163-Rhodomonas_salina.1
MKTVSTFSRENNAGSHNLSFRQMSGEAPPAALLEKHKNALATVKQLVSEQFIERLEKLEAMTVVQLEEDGQSLKVSVRVEWSSPALQIGDETSCVEKYRYDCTTRSVSRIEDLVPAFGGLQPPA